MAVSASGYLVGRDVRIRDAGNLLLPPDELSTFLVNDPLESLN